MTGSRPNAGPNAESHAGPRGGGASRVPRLSAGAISFTFPGRTTPALQHVNVEIHPGTFACIVGPNGSGKSTLARILAGLQRATEGAVWLGPYDMHDHYSLRELARLRAFVPQSPEAHAAFRIDEIVAMGCAPGAAGVGAAGLGAAGGDAGGSAADRRQRIDDCLAALDLTALRACPIDQVSGGEQRRAHLARALVQDAPLLILDEPTQGLDVRHQIELFKRLQALAASGSTTVVVVTHDLELAGRFASHLLLLCAGKLRAAGAPDEALDPALLSEVFGCPVRRVPDPEGGAALLRFGEA